MQETLSRSLIETRRRGERRGELLILALYPLAWGLLFAASTSHWFLPAGLRVAALLMLPRRTWPWLALFEWGVLLLARQWDEPAQSPLLLAASIILPWCIYAATVRACRPESIVSLSPKSIVRLTMCALIAAVGNAVVLAQTLPQAAGEVGANHLLFRYMLSNFTGVLLLVPFLFTAREWLLTRRVAWRSLFANGLVFVPLGLIGLSALPINGWEKYSLIFAFMPLFWIASRAGWRAGCIALILVEGGVYAMEDILFAAWDPLKLQLLLAITICATLLIGSASEAVESQARALVRMVNILSARTRSLSDAANRLTSHQEESSRRLGRELHDQLGQDMTAIAVQLRLLERRIDEVELRNSVRAIERLVDTAHGHLRDAINHLHPLVLDRFGLSRALIAGPIAEMTRSKQIDYRCTLEGDVDSLPPAIANAIYRICQEATTNAVRHGCGGRLHVFVSVELGSRLSMRTEDDAGAISIPPEHLGFGLQGIEDRANAIGATYRFNAASGNPRHWLQIVMLPMA